MCVTRGATAAAVKACAVCPRGGSTVRASPAQPALLCVLPMVTLPTRAASWLPKWCPVRLQQPHSHQPHLGMPNVQVSVGLWREAGDHLAARLSQVRRQNVRRVADVHLAAVAAAEPSSAAS